MSERKLLGDLFTLEYGNALPAEKRSGHGYPVFGSSGLVGFHEKPLVPGPGIVVGRKGTVGSITWSEDSFWPIDTSYFVQPRTTLSLRWLFWLLKSLPLGRLDTSTGVPGLNRNDVAEIPAFVPPLPEQRRIAAILDTLDRTIEGTQRVIEKLQATRQGLLHDLLTRGLDERGQLRDLERNPEQFKETELGRVPRDWEVGLLKEFCEVRGGKRLPAGHSYAEQTTDYAYLRVTDFFDKAIQISELPSLNPSTFRALQRYEITPGDACISIAGSIGSCAAFPSMSNRRVILTENAARLLTKASTSSKFITLLLNSPSVQSQIGLAIGTGGGVPKLALFRIEQLHVPMPSLEEQERILSRLDGLEERLAGEQARLAKLHALKRGLMEDLLTGRMRVPLAVGEVENSQAPSAVRTDEAGAFSLPHSILPPPLPSAPQPRAMYRAGAGANPEAMTEWTRQLGQAVQGQRVGAYSPTALDAVLPELLALLADRDGLLRVPEVLARAGIRFMLLPHTTGSRTSGAAFYLDEPQRTQPVIGLSFLRPYLDVFWFNLLHELAHLRLGHEPVPGESLDPNERDTQSADEQAANAWARDRMIPEAMWRAFRATGLYDSNRIKRFAGKLGRHPAIVAGRLGFETGEWQRFNQPELRPNVSRELQALSDTLKP